MTFSFVNFAFIPFRYIDANGNGKYDEGIDEPLANTRVYITGNATFAANIPFMRPSLESRDIAAVSLEKRGVWEDISSAVLSFVGDLNAKMAALCRVIPGSGSECTDYENNAAWFASLDPNSPKYIVGYVTHSDGSTEPVGKFDVWPPAPVVGNWSIRDKKFSFNLKNCVPGFGIYYMYIPLGTCGKDGKMSAVIDSYGGGTHESIPITEKAPKTGIKSPEVYITGSDAHVVVPHEPIVVDVYPIFPHTSAYPSGAIVIRGYCSQPEWYDDKVPMSTYCWQIRALFDGFSVTTNYYVTKDGKYEFKFMIDAVWKVGKVFSIIQDLNKNISSPPTVFSLPGYKPDPPILVSMKRDMNDGHFTVVWTCSNVTAGLLIDKYVICQNIRSSNYNVRQIDTWTWEYQFNHGAGATVSANQVGMFGTSDSSSVVLGPAVAVNKPVLVGISRAYPDGHVMITIACSDGPAGLALYFTCDSLWLQTNGEFSKVDKIDAKTRRFHMKPYVLGGRTFPAYQQGTDGQSEALQIDIPVINPAVPTITSVTVAFGWVTVKGKCSFVSWNQWPQYPQESYCKNVSFVSGTYKYGDTVVKAPSASNNWEFEITGVTSDPFVIVAQYSNEGVSNWAGRVAWTRTATKTATTTKTSTQSKSKTKTATRSKTSSTTSRTLSKTATTSVTTASVTTLTTTSSQSATPITTSLAVVNFDFETDGLADNGFSNNPGVAPTGWSTFDNGGGGLGAFFGYFNPSSSGYYGCDGSGTNGTMSGPNVCYLGSIGVGQGFTQALSHNVTMGAYYEMTVALGARVAGLMKDAKLQLRAGTDAILGESVVLASDYAVGALLGGFADFSVSATVNNATLVGLPLTVYVLKGSGGVTEVDFDNVRVKAILPPV